MSRILPLLAVAILLAACSPGPVEKTPVPLTPPSETAGAPVVRRAVPEPAALPVPPPAPAVAAAPIVVPRRRDLRLRFGRERRSADHRHRIRAEGPRPVREESGDGSVPIRAQCLPRQRGPRLCREWRRDHDADRGGIRQEGDARPIQVKLADRTARRPCLRRSSLIHVNSRPFAIGVALTRGECRRPPQVAAGSGPAAVVPHGPIGPLRKPRRGTMRTKGDMAGRDHCDGCVGARFRRSPVGTNEDQRRHAQFRSDLGRREQARRPRSEGHERVRRCPTTSASRWTARSWPFRI